jgi:hypothetical protein
MRDSFIDSRARQEEHGVVLIAPPRQRGKAQLKTEVTMTPPGQFRRSPSRLTFGL